MATATITITDRDLDVGTVDTEITIVDHALDDGFMTAAHMYAKFIAHSMNDPAFLSQVWRFAEDLIANASGVSIANEDYKIENPANDSAACEAA